MTGAPRPRRAFAGLALLALAGCTTVGPNYRVPDKAAVKLPAANAPFQEKAAAVPGNGPDAPVPARWWHLYDDPVLDRLEEQALAANTDLAVAAANIARAHAVSDAANARHEPEFSVYAEPERARLSAESFLLDQPLPVENLANVGVQMTYQVDLFGRIRRSVEAARADAEATEAIAGSVRVTVAADVARAYLGQCAAAEQAALAEATLAEAEHALDIARRLDAAGRGASTGVTEASARVELARAQIPALRARSRAALYRLAWLLGRPPADYPRDAENCHTLPTIGVPLPVGDGAALLRRRPDVRAAERQLAAATARIGVATAALYPDVGLGAGLGSFGFLRDIGTGPANFWNLGGLIQWSIPNGGARARVRGANAEADAALARFDGTVLTALRETETALSTYAEDRNRANALAAARHEAEKNAAEVREMRRAGKSPLSADIAARQTTIGARSAEAAARETLAQDQVNVFLALGGGW